MSHTMATRILESSSIKYTCVMLSAEDYESFIADVPDKCVLGVVANGVYHPAEDLTLHCATHWSLPILDSYRDKFWIILNKHPSNVYTPMSDITGQDLYVVREYDAWRTDLGNIAVATHIDMD